MKKNAFGWLGNIFKIITGIFLFCYFGFFIFPEWSRPWSPRFILWLYTLPIVLIALVITGIRGGIGLWRETFRQVLPNPQNKYFIWVATFGVLWFFISLALAGRNYSALQKFDVEKWKSSNWEDGDVFELSAREWMLDDLMNNVLPGRTKTEVTEILGQPDEISNVGVEETFYYYTSWGIMDPKCLFIRFDEQGVIREYDVTLCG